MLRSAVQKINRLIEQSWLQTDAARAGRATLAFSIPLLVCHWLQQPSAGLFISSAALNLSLPDLRGAYKVRLSILVSMTLVAAVSALLGVLSAHNLFGAVIAMGFVALFGGIWRHLTADYGPSMAVSSALLFLLGLSQTGGWSFGLHLAELVGIGGAIAALMHVTYWLFRPQHALRYAVAESWVAASDLVAAMRLGTLPERKARAESVNRQERELRATLDRTFVILGAAQNRQQARLLEHLEAMRREVVHFTMRLMACNTSLETLMEQPRSAGFLPVIDSVLKALSDAARSVALTLIMHRAENFAASNTRLRRCQHLIEALDQQMATVSTPDPDGTQLRATLHQIERELPRIQAILRETADHVVGRPGLSASLPDLSARSIQSLGAWIRPASRPDPVLIRHLVRMAVFTMIAVALYKGFSIPRGYWIAFTIMVVLQPDYGSTRQRAVERIGGTISGIVLAGALLWIRMPWFVLDGLATATACVFAFFLKRRYGLAIFFVTINLVLITETLAPVRRDFMVLRVLSTFLGGAFAFIAARMFWPIWEGEKFTTLLAAAICANESYLKSLFAWFGTTPPVPIEPLMAKRRAENANRYVAASLERLLGEPATRQEKPERAAALATYNQRVTRALTVLALHLPESNPQVTTPVAAAASQIADILEALANAIENGSEGAIPPLAATLANLEAEFANESSSSMTWAQLAKTLAEIRAMILALRMTT